MPMPMTEFTAQDAAWWAKRGVEDALKGKTPLMYVSVSGKVVSDIDPPEHWSYEYEKAAARAYYAAYIGAT